MAADLQPGDKAPDFDMASDEGGNLRLSDFAGRPLVLYFYPKDDTTGCTNEAKAFTEARGQFDKAGATVIGVSKDSTRSHARFRQKYGLDLRLGSDPEGEIIERYGVWVEKSMYGRSYMGIERATYLIDAAGLIRRVWRKVKVKGHVEDVLAALMTPA